MVLESISAPMAGIPAAIRRASQHCSDPSETPSGNPTEGPRRSTTSKPGHSTDKARPPVGAGNVEGSPSITVTRFQSTDSIVQSVRSKNRCNRSTTTRPYPASASST